MNPEDLLTDALHHRVERTDYPSTPLSTVAGRAGAIRARRRRTTALAAAAAVGVVVVPGAVWLGHSSGGSPQPTHELTSGPTSSPTSHPITTDGLASLPLGAKPGIDYIDGDTYVTMDGHRISSPTFGTAGTATPLRGGILAAQATPDEQVGPFHLSHIALVVDGTSQPLGCGTARFAMSTDGVQSAYWLADSCTPGGAGNLYTGADNTMGETGPAATATPAGAIDEPVGILQQGVVVNDVGSDHANGPTPLLIGWDGTTNRLTTLGAAAGSDENNDVVSGQLASDSSTGAIVDAATGAVRLRVPGWQLGQFSTDGKYVIGVQRVDGAAFADRYAILDAATGDQVARLDQLGDGVTLQQIAWDFDGTLLAVATDGHDEVIVRFDRHGHATRATPVRTVTGGNDVYRLATRP